jgi:hypothetical protein
VTERAMLGPNKKRGTMKVEYIVCAFIIVFGATFLSYKYLPCQTLQIPTSEGCIKVTGLTDEEMNTLKDCKKMTELIAYIKNLDINSGSEEDILKKVDFELYYHSNKIIKRLGTEHYNIIIKELK